MCGISGLFAAELGLGALDERGRIVRSMTDSLSHRGPDAGGMWHDPAGRCSLGHRRLSIIDTSARGNQPMFSADGRWVISFNGELYNYLELRPLVEAAGGKLAGRTDTEVLLAALELWGVEALSRLDGMFAFAAFDTMAGELILARDPFGEKPLYYAELAAGQIAFASELQAIERVPGIDLEVDLDSVAELLMFQYVGAPRTIYRRVRKLPPGHWLRAQPGQSLRIGRYFEFKPGASGMDQRPLPDMVDECEEILTRLISRRLISDVPLGAFLSGGVDSSTVCALIRRRLGAPLKTFSIGFEGAPESEHETARAFANHLGTEHHEKIVAPHASDFLVDIGRLLDEPNADSSCLPTWLLSKFARKSVTVALSGDGGDEMFGGYGRYFQTFDEARRAVRGWDSGAAYYSNRILVSVEMHIEELFGQVPAEAAAHLHRLREEARNPATPLVCRLRKTDVDNYMPGAVLPKVDRMSMQHALEVRTPFLGVEMARFAERLPLSAVYDGRRGKVLLRELAYRYLPRELIDLPKQGFGIPVAKWGRSELLSTASRLLESPDGRLRDALGTAAISRFMARQRSDHGFATYQVWALTMLESWLRHHPAVLPRISSTERLGAQVGAPVPTTSSRDAHLEIAASFPRSLQAWPIGRRLYAIVEDSSIDLERWRLGEAAAGSLMEEILHLLSSVSTEDTHEPNEASPPIAAHPIQLPPWATFDRDHIDRRTKLALKGATLLLPRTTIADQAGWGTYARLRDLGVEAIAMRHPARTDNTIFVLRMCGKSRWRDLLDSRRLSRAGLGQELFASAAPHGERSRSAYPLSDLPAAELEMSDRFMVFEGPRQLPPVPVSHAAIASRGKGRYSIWSRHAIFSETGHPSAARAQRWLVERRPDNEHLLQFVPQIVSPSLDARDRFLPALRRWIAHDADPVPTRDLQTGSRIVVLTHALPPGGAERQWCYLACELHRRGFDVKFVVTKVDLAAEERHYLPMLLNEGVEFLPLRDQTVAETLSSLPTDSGRRELAAMPSNPFGTQLAELTALLTRLKPSALFAQLDYPNLLAGTAAALAGVPHIVMSFRSYNPSHVSYLLNDWFHPLYQVLAESKRIRFAGNSPAGNDDYADWIGVPRDRVAFIPNAIDPDLVPVDAQRQSRLRIELGLEPDRPVVLGVFRLSEEKRPLVFVEVCARIAARLPSVRVLIVGIGPLEAAMRERIDELHIADVVQFLGRREDIGDLMIVSSLLLLTSAFEGMPNVVLESQLVGTPVVASRVGAVADCVIDGQTGFIVESDDMNGYVERCLTILEDPELRTRLAKAGTTQMRRFFSRSAMTEGYLDIASSKAVSRQAAPAESMDTLLV
jgi:asparagine synthase (glutamine-hydrolysing)